LNILFVEFLENSFEPKLYRGEFYPPNPVLARYNHLVSAGTPDQM